MRRCRVCGELKSCDEFHRATGMRDGARSECKPCFRELARQRYDSAEAVARTQQWREDNPERYAAYRAEYRNRPERKRAMRDLYYRRTLGISADDVDAMLEAQGRLCDLRLAPRTARVHACRSLPRHTGRIRGLLCINCNQGIGKFAEIPERLEKAAAYLRGR